MTARDRAARAVLTRLDVLVDDIVAGIGEQIPAYRTLTPAQLAEVTAIAGWGVRRILELWTSDGTLTEADLHRFRGIGTARALDDRPLAGVLRAYRLAGERITDEIAADRAAGLTVVDAMALARLWMAAIDEISEALYLGHSEAARRLDEDRDRALAELLADLLDGRRVTLTALADRARRLDLSLPARPSVVVLAPPPDVGARQLVDTVLSAAGLAAQDDVLRLVRDGRAVVVCDAAQAAALLGELTGAADGARAACVAATGPAEIRTAHRLADHALTHAPGHAFAARPWLSYGDALLLALLTPGSGPAPDPAAMASAVLGEALTPDNAHLLEGLRAVVRTGSAVAAAAHLEVHPQTVRYRLRRVHEITGRSTSDPWDLFVLGAAVLAAGS